MNAPASFTKRQVADWRAYEKVRASGKWNMWDVAAQKASGLRRADYLFCIQHYTALKEAAAAQLLAEIERRHALGEIE